jgi:hypothetical protein
MLKDVGVYSIENFWYILKDTWLHQIQLQYQSTNYHAKVNYTRHITTANNQDLENISISTPLEQAIFFSTLSLVFNISIQINTIHQNSYIKVLVNKNPSPNNLKIINTRKSVQGKDIF